ncbi:MAG: dockerin type I repeat-containing protein [Prevotella sp.]|nr:dockerin type I repeat-containing protein [Prevotella sp.]
MNKMIMNRLTMLAVTLMASIACFAQGNAKMTTTLLNQPHSVGDIVDLYELRYYIVADNGGNCLELEVIGFASDITGTVSSVYTTTPGDPTKVRDEYNGILEIPSTYPAEEVGVKCYVSSIAANAFTATTCRGDDAKYKSKFADAAALVNKIRIDYSDEFPDAITIDNNAFGSLTGVTEVENLTPGAKIEPISTNAFATSVYKTAILTVTELESTGHATVKAYAKTDGWKKFYKKSDGAILLGDTTGDGNINVFDINRIKKMIANTQEKTEAADFNGDGAVNVFDVNALKKVIAKTY